MSEIRAAGNMISPARTTAQANQSVGMIARVVRGSLWTLGGQGVTVLAMLVTTPYVIRQLGAEAYGVLTLINVLIGYLAFADLGMGQAATRFGANAHARQNEAEEAAVVQTSLIIAGVPAVLCASGLALSAVALVESVLRLPPHLHAIAVWSLRIAAIGFVARTLTGVLAAPQLVRLRLDLNMSVVAGTALVQGVLVVLVLWLQGGLIAAVMVMAGAAVAGAIAHAIICWRLLPSLLAIKIDLTLVKSLLRFGGGLVLSTLAAIALLNAEKLLLPRFASVTALAYYGVAYSVAGILALAPTAMRQALLPAFSRLQAANEEEGLKQLYLRALRGNLLGIGPVALLLGAGAKSFFTFWAGPEYGTQSTMPFYILLVGLIFNVLAYVPYTLVMAYGRSDIIARVHVGELIPYLLCAALLTYWFGAVGAALAWALRTLVDAILFAVAAHHLSGFPFSPLPVKRGSYAIAVALLLVPLAFVGQSTMPSVLLVIAVMVSILAYAKIIWARVLSAEERLWLSGLIVWHRAVSNS